MTNEQFREAIQSSYEGVKRKYGGDAANRASIALLEKGPEDFDCPRKLRNYFFSCAHGYQRKDLEKERREHVKRWGVTYTPASHVSSLELDLERAIAGWPDDEQEAMRAYFLEGETVGAAAKRIRSGKSLSSSRGMVRTAIATLKSSTLRDYFRAGEK